MKRETISDFFDKIQISERGLVKVASSKIPGDKVVISSQEFEKTLNAFDNCPDMSKEAVQLCKKRAELGLEHKVIIEDFLKDFCEQRKSKNEMHIITAKTLRQAGIFKVAGRDVYEDLQTSEFWKISDDKKHVVRLFKENENGISNKNASIDVEAMSKDSLINAISDIYDERNSIEKWDDFVEEVHKLLDKVGSNKDEDIDVGLEKVDIKDLKKLYNDFVLENYADSVEFSSLLDKMTGLVKELKKIIPVKKLEEFFKATDETYDTQSQVEFYAFLHGLERYDSLLEEINQAK